MPDLEVETIKIQITMKKEQNLNNVETQALNIPVVSKRLFLCDICGQEKGGRKFPVLDENWNKQSGLNQCEDCFKEGCGID